MPSLAVTSSSEFTDAAPTDRPTVQIVSPTRFVWGDGSEEGSPQSSLTFQGQDRNVEPDGEFSLGTLNYFNGVAKPDTEAWSVKLNVTLAFTWKGESVSIDLGVPITVYTTTNDEEDEISSADYLYVGYSYDGDFTTAKGQRFRLELVGLDNAQGSIVANETDEHYLTVLERGSAQAELAARLAWDDDPDDALDEAHDLGAIDDQTDQAVGEQEISSPHDVDMFAFTAEAGQTLTFDVDFRPGASTNWDCYVRLFDILGNELDYNNNGNADDETGNQSDSFLRYSFETTGKYFIGVSHYYNYYYDPLNGEDDYAPSLNGPASFRLTITNEAPFTVKLVQGILQVEGNAQDNYVKVDEAQGRIRVFVQDAGGTLRATPIEVGNRKVLWVAAGAVKRVTMALKSGDDTGFNSTSKPGELKGGIGVDKLFGGSARDYLQGGPNDDELHGNGGNDVLQGEEDSDQLFGDAGNDFLDAGSPAESVDGGLGADYNAFVPVIGGTTYDDVFQRSRPNCAFMAALSSVAYRGLGNLEDRIQYVGNFEYDVSLYDDGVLKPLRITFQGDHNPRLDPTPRADQEEFWTILYQRAADALFGSIFGQFTQTAANSMAALTGQEPKVHEYAFLPFISDELLATLAAAHREGRAIIAGTSSNGLFVSIDPSLVRRHTYAILDVDAGRREITLRNPWGANKDRKGNGVTTITWRAFTKSMIGIYISN